MTTANSSGFAQLARMVWIMFAPMGLTVTLLIIATSPGSGWRTTADIVYLVLLPAMVIARWIEFAAGDATSGTGDPINRADVVRYSIIVVAGGLAAWVCANIVANYVL